MYFLKTIAFILLTGFIFQLNAQNNPPNVIFIMADDIGAECLGKYGGQSYHTPNLDKLADDGVLFTNAYTTPLCTPTRVQVMTGQYPFRNGWTGGIWVLPKEEQLLDPETYNFGRMLKNEGYATAIAGKWQLGRFDIWPDQLEKMGFDEHCMWTWRYAKETPESVREEGPDKLARFWNPGIWRNGELMDDVDGKYGPDIYTDFLIDFMERHQNQPFFLYFPMTLSHFPFVKVPGGKEGQTKQENFADMVEYMDMLVGKIVKKTADLGITDNTLIIFTGDNGTDRQMETKINGEILRGGKGQLNDAGTRVPFVLKWPAQVMKGEIVNELIDLSDVLPTFAEISGAEIPPSHKIDGKSIMSLLGNKNAKIRDWIFCQLGDNWLIRTKNYRLHNNGQFVYLPEHYHPEEVDIQSNSAARKVKQELKKAVQNFGIKK